MALRDAPLKVLCAVVPRTKAGEANTLLSELGTCVNYTMLGQKINYKKIANIMGINNFECVMIISVVPTEFAHKALVEFNNKMHLLEIGGVAFLIPLSAISKNALIGCFDFYDESQAILEERNAEINAIMQESEKEGGL